MLMFVYRLSCNTVFVAIVQ